MGSGIEAPRRLTYSTLVIATFTLSHCRGSQTEPNVDLDSEVDNLDDGTGTLLDDELGEQIEENLPLTHPASATVWNTKVFLMATKKPPQEKLESCRVEIEKLGDEAINQESLLLTSKKIGLEVRRFRYLYHWCFYYVVGDLDQKLLNDGLGLLLEERAQKFQKTMKVLWILATSLNEATQRKVYLSYLKKRYIQMSRDFFGRNLDVYGKPLHKRLKQSAPELKEADEYQDE